MPNFLSLLTKGLIQSMLRLEGFQGLEISHTAKYRDSCKVGFSVLGLETRVSKQIRLLRPLQFQFLVLAAIVVLVSLLIFNSPFTEGDYQHPEFLLLGPEAVLHARIHHLLLMRYGP